MNTLSLIAALTVLAGTPAGAADLPPEFSVPFGCGLAFPVSQAHNTGSHLNTDVYAWDFKMPEGIPITAAADGVVRLARGDSSVGGCGEEYAPYANYVIIAHAGGYETQYLHFQKVVVQAGEKVHAGDIIGYSGKTGWACGSHLHFKVTRATGNGWNNDSVPARIIGYGDPEVQTLVFAPSCNAANKAPMMAEAPKGNDQPASAAQNALQQQLPSGQQSVETVTGQNSNTSGTGAGQKAQPKLSAQTAP